MKTLAGNLVEAKVKAGKREVWVRLALAATPEEAVAIATNPKTQYQNIVETRITPYYRIEQKQQAKTPAPVVRVRPQPVPRMIASVAMSA